MKKLLSWVVPLIAVQMFLLWYSSFTVWPEMVIYPYLVKHGFLLYKDIINPYFPFLTVLMTGFFSVVSLTVLNLKILTYLIILSSDFSLVFVSWKLSKSVYKTLFSLLIFTLLQYSYGGNGLWFELALAPFLLISIYLLFQKGLVNVLLSGVFLAICIGIKQNSTLFLIPVTFYLLVNKRYRDIFYLGIPIALVLIVQIIVLQSLGVLTDFYHWALILPLSFSKQPGFILMPAIRQYPLILFPAAALVGLLLGKDRNLKLFWALTFLIALSFAFPRYEDFHLQILVLLSSLITIYLNKRVAVVFLLITLLIFTRSANKLFNKPDRFIDQQTLSLAEVIKSYPSVYLLNAPDLTYYFANKLPPKPWAISFPWYFEQPGFQERFISALKDQQTEYLVVGEKIGGGKYSLGNYYPDKVFEYIYSHYQKVEQNQQFEIWRLIR